MQVLAIVFFGVAIALSAWLLPNNMFLLRLLSVSAARALALVLALVFWVACERLDSWGSNRVAVALGTIVGTLALAGGCLFIQMTRDDNVPAPWPWVYRVTAGLLPICFMASVYLRSGKMFIIVSLLAPVVGILLGTAWKPLNAIYIANQPKSKEQLENEALLAQLERIPAGAGPESFVELIKPDETWDVRTKVQARIEATPDWTARLAAMLDGDKRLNVLYVLTRKTGSLPDDVLARCWSAAEAVAREQTELLKKGNVPKKSDEEMLNDSVHEINRRQRAICIGKRSQRCRNS